MLVTLLLSTVAVFSTGYLHVNGQKQPFCEISKDVFVQFHGWKYSDIEKECIESTSAYYCAFQVHSPFEHQYATISAPPNAQFPWWERYQTISWYETTDSGSAVEFNRMVETCNANNIRIYVDLEMNNAGASTGSGLGSSGSYYDGDYHNMPHFNGPSFYHQANTAAPTGCPTASGVIEDYSNRSQIRYCNRLSCPITSATSPNTDLLDLRTDLESVRVGYVTAMNNLLNGLGGRAEEGIAGFRLAHARWVEPNDLQNISARLEDLKIPGVFNVRPFIYSEVYPDAIISHTEYYSWGNVEETRAGPLLSDIIRKQHSTYRLANLTSWGPSMGLMNSGDAIVFIDDPASQRGWPELTDLNKVLTFRDVRNYQLANAFMLAHNYGYPRIQSSYFWNRTVINNKDVNDYRGPPRDENSNIEDVVTNGASCLSEWNCEHRWTSIRGLTRFRNLMNQDGAVTVNNFWTNGYEQIAFSRGSSGFFVINNENSDLIASIYTSMPAGTYCDLATDSNPIADPCDGRTVTVGGDGRAAINLPAGDAVPFIAITRI